MPIQSSDGIFGTTYWGQFIVERGTDYSNTPGDLKNFGGLQRNSKKRKTYSLWYSE